MIQNFHMKIKNYWLKTFLRGYLIGMLLFVFILGYLVYVAPYFYEQDFKLKPQNSILKSLEDKDIYNIHTKQRLHFHQDTLYLLYFSYVFDELTMEEFKYILQLEKQQT